MSIEASGTRHRKEMSRVDFLGSIKSISEKEFLLFRNYIMDHTGISIPPEKSYLIETRLSKLMAESGFDAFEAFYDFIIENEDPPAMQRKIINAITINETLWFRDETPWKILEARALPRLVEAIRVGRKTRARIWCAAVSTGQEVYSTVMCVDNYLKKHGVKDVTLSDFDFFATDISSNVLDIAKKGRYDKISIMRGLSDYYREMYFTPCGSAWDIDPRIRGAVRFANFNLKNSFQLFGAFDIIFCRYVLIYFPDDLKKEIIRKMSGALTEGGMLFTGSYVLYDLFKDDFEPNHYENLTYYTKKAVSE